VRIRTKSTASSSRFFYLRRGLGSLEPRSGRKLARVQTRPARFVRAISLIALIAPVVSGTLPAPAGAEPLNAKTPSIAGSPWLGNTLTEVPGVWSGTTGAIAVQWEDCPSSLAIGCTAIPGSPTTPGSQYAPTPRDIGKWITVLETGLDGQGDVSQTWAYPVGPVTLGAATATMQWTFYYTPVYTSVLAMLINGLGSGMTVTVGCHGNSCPFARHAAVVAPGHRCPVLRGTICTRPGTLNLAPGFRGHRLVVGTWISVEISSPSGIGKYYRFTVKPRRGPLIDIGCMSPGQTSPGHSCQAG
jgi:hypothetical protein